MTPTTFYLLYPLTLTTLLLARHQPLLLLLLLTTATTIPFRFPKHRASVLYILPALLGLSVYLHPGAMLLLFLVITTPVVLCWWGAGSNIAYHMVVVGRVGWFYYTREVARVEERSRARRRGGGGGLGLGS